MPKTQTPHTPRYSQRNEQEHILRAVQYLEPSAFLDIGAYDGLTFSNTRALVEQGWIGAMVEPGLDAFQKLLRNYGESPAGIELINAAVSTVRHLEPFWNNPTCYSTTEGANLRKWKPTEPFSRRYYVPTITFEDLAPYIGDFLEVVSIDTEGTSVELLLYFPMEKYRPKVFIVEHDGRLDTCLNFAQRYCYDIVMENAENVVIVRR